MVHLHREEGEVVVTLERFELEGWFAHVGRVYTFPTWAR
jgi:hypothetical protein